MAASIRGLAALAAAAVSPLVDLVLPLDCAGCGVPDQKLCLDCRSALLVPAHPVPTASGRPDLLAALPVASAAAYDDVVARIVHAWKDDGRRDLTGPLATALASAVGVAVGEIGGSGETWLWLVPVPSSRSAVRRRGEDVGRLLARTAAELISGEGRRGGPAQALAVPLLHQVRPVADQAGLGVEERARNLTGALAVRRPGSGQGTRPAEHPAARSGTPGPLLVVVDDVMTTGASAAEAVRALRAGGFPVIAVATACHTPRRRAYSPNGRCPAGIALD